jgi:transporter family-2 protein
MLQTIDEEKSLESIGLFWFMLAAIMVGIAVPTQAGINSQLGKALGDPFLASFASFSVGILSVLALMLVNQIAWPSVARLAEVPWWAWTGGIFGALFVTAMILLAPRLGATTTVSLVIAGQMLASLVFDHFAYFGFPQHPLSWMRFLGASLVIAGVFLIQRF